MVWTHFYDLLVKIFLFIGMIVISTAGLDWIESAGIMVPGVVVMIVILGLFCITYHFLLRTLSSYLYARFSLKMRISYPQAKQFNPAFTTLLPMQKWLPMEELFLYPEEDRYQRGLELLERHDMLNAELSRRIAESPEKPGFSKKAYEIAVVSVVVICAIIGLGNYPPANYLSELQGRFLGDGSYYPLLNILILVLPPGLVLYAIERRMKG